jgi:hypothetical protein
MSFNWSNIGSTISGISSALSAAGVSAASIPTLLSSIGLASNPNQSEELTLCSQLLMAANNVALAQALAMKLAVEAGIPASAAALAVTLGQPNVDIPTRVMQIEQIIKNGG